MVVILYMIRLLIECMYNCWFGKQKRDKTSWEKDLKLHYLSFVSINNFGFKNILSKLSNFYEMPANTFDK